MKHSQKDWINQNGILRNVHVTHQKARKREKRNDKQGIKRKQIIQCHT